MVNIFQREQKILASLCENEVENLDDHGCPKDKTLFDEEMWICSSHPFRKKTKLHCAKRPGNMFGIWIMRHLKL